MNQNKPITQNQRLKKYDTRALAGGDHWTECQPAHQQRCATRGHTTRNGYIVLQAEGK